MNSTNKLDLNIKSQLDDINKGESNNYNKTNIVNEIDLSNKDNQINKMYDQNMSKTVNFDNNAPKNINKSNERIELNNVLIEVNDINNVKRKETKRVLNSKKYEIEY